MSEVRPTTPSRALRIIVPIMFVTLAGCASKPADNISLIPAVTGQETSKQGLFTQPIKFTHRKPGCEGDCPTLTVDSLVFPGIPRLTELVDHALARMTGIGDNSPVHGTVSEYEAYFFNTAAPRDETVLSAKTRYRNRHLTVIELQSYQYFTGAAHGIPATQFLNWHNERARLLGLEDMLAPGQRPAFVQALRTAHERWLAQNQDALNDMATYQRLWPFQESENVALTDAGLVVKYDAYQIAPYSHGQPELTIPYSQLQGILRPEFMPV